MIRLMPPADGLRPTITVNGRSYTCALGSTIDVVDHDAAIMMHNGWVAADIGGVGATVARPAKPQKGDTFFDSTLGYNIRFDGKVWRNPATGAQV